MFHPSRCYDNFLLVADWKCLERLLSLMAGSGSLSWPKGQRSRMRAGWKCLTWSMPDTCIVPGTELMLVEWINGDLFLTYANCLQETARKIRGGSFRGHRASVGSWDCLWVKVNSLQKLSVIRSRLWLEADLKRICFICLFLSKTLWGWENSGCFCELKWSKSTDFNLSFSHRLSSLSRNSAFGTGSRTSLLENLEHTLSWLLLPTAAFMGRSWKTLA